MNVYSTESIKNIEIKTIGDGTITNIGWAVVVHHGRQAQAEALHHSAIDRVGRRQVSLSTGEYYVEGDETEVPGVALVVGYDQNCYKDPEEVAHVGADWSTMKYVPIEPSELGDINRRIEAVSAKLEFSPQDLIDLYESIRSELSRAERSGSHGSKAASKRAEPVKQAFANAEQVA